MVPHKNARAFSPGAFVTGTTESGALLGIY